MDKVATIMLNTNGYFFSNEDHQVKLSTSFPLLSTGFGSGGYTINLRISCEYASTSLLRTWIKMFGNPSKLSRTLILDDVTNFGSNEEIVFKFLFLKGSFFKMYLPQEMWTFTTFSKSSLSFSFTILFAFWPRNIRFVGSILSPERSMATNCFAFLHLLTRVRFHEVRQESPDHIDLLMIYFVDKRLLLLEQHNI